MNRLLLFPVILVMLLVVPTMTHAQVSLIPITQEDMKDEYGHIMRNMDGTYYAGDRTRFVVDTSHISAPRDDKIRIETTINTSLMKQGMVVWSEQGMNYRTYPITVTVNVISEKWNKPIHSESKTFYYQLVPYRPSLDTFPYTMLTDGERYSYHDRTAVAISFHGSRGNNLSDDTIYPQRRLMLHENFTSSAYAMEYTYKNTPFYINGTNVEYPAGIQEVRHDDVLDISNTEQKPFIYMNQSGYHKEFYRTVPKMSFDGIRTLNINFTYYWLDYIHETDYAIPKPREAIANSYMVAANPVHDFKVIVQPKEEKYKDALMFTELKDYIQAKIMQEFNDPEFADFIAVDMPSSYAEAVSNENGAVLVRVIKSSIFLPALAVNETSTIPDFGGIVGESFTPMRVTIISHNIPYIKEYSLYNFNSDYLKIIDSRQNLPLELARSGNTVNVQAPWDIEKLEGGHVSSCLGSVCILTQTRTGDVIKVYNEFGGSATGTVQEMAAEESPLTEKVINDFRFGVAFILTVAGCLVLARWFLSKK